MRKRAWPIRLSGMSETGVITTEGNPLMPSSFQIRVHAYVDPSMHNGAIRPLYLMMTAAQARAFATKLLKVARQPRQALAALEAAKRQQDGGS